MTRIDERLTTAPNGAIEPEQLRLEIGCCNNLVVAGTLWRPAEIWDVPGLLESEVHDGAAAPPGLGEDRPAVAISVLVPEPFRQDKSQSSAGVGVRLVAKELNSAELVAPADDVGFFGTYAALDYRHAAKLRLREQDLAVQAGSRDWASIVVDRRDADLALVHVCAVDLTDDFGKSATRDPVIQREDVLADQASVTAGDSFFDAVADRLDIMCPVGRVLRRLHGQTDDRPALVSTGEGPASRPLQRQGEVVCELARERLRAGLSGVLSLHDPVLKPEHSFRSPRHGSGDTARPANPDSMCYWTAQNSVWNLRQMEHLNVTLHIGQFRERFRLGDVSSKKISGLAGKLGFNPSDHSTIHVEKNFRFPLHGSRGGQPPGHR